LPGHGRRVRQDPYPVRTAHREFPGHQAQVRRHVARGGVVQVRRLLRGVGRGEDSDELPVVASLAKSYCSEATSTPRPRTSRSTGDRLHLEHPAHLYFKRAKVVRAALRRPGLSPGAAGPAHRHLNRRRPDRLADLMGREGAILGLWPRDRETAPAIGRTRERRPRTVIGSPTWSVPLRPRPARRLRTSMIGSIGSWPRSTLGEL